MSDYSDPNESYSNARSLPALPNGNISEYACGPLTKPRYINPKIEQELVEFKIEINDKFQASDINNVYKFPRPLLEKQTHQIVRPTRFINFSGPLTTETT
jgi:hypothetical protein